ncbi:glucose-6-phosphate dehydrogenase assembly protein OpcA [Jatrophihabitans lederbergiae]|uniref:Glucose-6-phosphate dehydrogenase assembly protein OpcA n=1 Tax=Jatrophihabitans lederbergiae TaxID=3075547 RepID=A0ABU2J6V4_9ACTN|nr:glucose-6-phosphate dehydrogenase assembly protein OpcA [Jatrophihabitans sp. DSM 44399]MDT0260717.1 glucose-6-phosphate dehydrogenase assembly protein OpcA [Jatrophihabitans sp. DSM 44399]
MTTLWDTTGTAVVKALAAERRSGGAVTSGLALTLVVVLEEKDTAVVEAAVATAAARHPMRVIMVLRHNIEAPVPRLDAEVSIGGRHGPGESVVLRMFGRLALHAESVTLPLLAPDAPVVAWWYSETPEVIAYDPLGVFADRRITNVIRDANPAASLQQRAVDYAPGDTDLTWTVITPWRAALAAAFDTGSAPATSVIVSGNPLDPSAQLLAGWLSSRLGIYVPVERAQGKYISSVSLDFADGRKVKMTNEGYKLLMRRPGQVDTIQPFPQRTTGDMLAEELRRLDADGPYGEALGAVSGLTGLNERPAVRTHIWHDPALAAREG